MKNIFKAFTLLFVLFLSGCGTTEIIKNPNTSSYTVTGNQSWATGGWDKASRDATQKAVDFCGKNNQNYVFISEQRNGVPGFSLLTSAISFTCGINIKEAMQVKSDECKAEMLTPELDPIRYKVELIKDDGSSSPSFDISTNTNFPTALEVMAIAKWAKIREVCDAKSKQVLSATDTPLNPMQTAYRDKQREFRDELTSQVNLLVVALYQGKLPYGEFAQKRYEVYLNIKSAERDFRSATLLQDRNAQMQAQDLAIKQQQNNINAWNNYMQSVNARQPQIQSPSTTRLQTNCITNKTGNTSTTNCN